MRAIQGQRSDSVPIRRTAAEKRIRLSEIEERLKYMKPHADAGLKATMRRTAAELRQELGLPAKG